MIDLFYFMDETIPEIFTQPESKRETNPMGLRTRDKNWLKTRFGDSIRFDEPMSGHTSLRVGGPADVFAIPETVEDLKELVTWSWKRRVPYTVVGGGTNLLVSDHGIRGVAILPTRCLNDITRHSQADHPQRVTVLTGVKLPAFCRYAIDHGLSGMQFALGIPGTVGGAIQMNAGTALGVMADVIESISVFEPEKGIRRIERESLFFAYRSLSLEQASRPRPLGPPIILAADFRLERADPHRLKQEARGILQKRKKREPAGVSSAGCFFKNPESGKTAGELIDQAGLKGYRVGGAEVSAEHANYIVNRRHATAADFFSLIKLIQETIWDAYGVRLDPEVKIIG